eukprot:COSAG01_NODE_41032_length_456_cov_2.324930_1_plen_32_part_01
MTAQSESNRWAQSKCTSVTGEGASLARGLAEP